MLVSSFQRDGLMVEAVLYGNGYAQTTDAVYLLLQRSGVMRDSPVTLSPSRRHACNRDQGTVTQGSIHSFTDNFTAGLVSNHRSSVA